VDLLTWAVICVLVGGKNQIGNTGVLKIYSSCYNWGGIISARKWSVHTAWNSGGGLENFFFSETPTFRTLPSLVGADLQKDAARNCTVYLSACQGRSTESSGAPPPRYPPRSRGTWSLRSGDQQLCNRSTHPGRVWEALPEGFHMHWFSQNVLEGASSYEQVLPSPKPPVGRRGDGPPSLHPPHHKILLLLSGLPTNYSSSSLHLNRLQ
jgi:hypothetical protein